MKIVWCLGGLGNQMFQYAFYRALQLLGHEVALDISNFAEYGLHNGFELTKVFGLSPIFATPTQINQVRDGFLNKLLRCLRLPNSLLIPNDFGFNQHYLSLTKTKYLQGYWQSEQYFSQFKQIVRQDFTFPVLDSMNQVIADRIAECNAVAMHVRRGDYVNHSLYHQACNLDYYNQAIQLIKAKLANPTFFIFSDDVAWCRDNLSLDQAVYVANNNQENSFRDMQLMSLCKHNIIANSSFSWWGAWLNQNPDKLVIAPAKWFNDSTINTHDLIPSTWNKI